jgi:hypothetical protein
VLVEEPLNLGQQPCGSARVLQDEDLETVRDGPPVRTPRLDLSRVSVSHCRISEQQTASIGKFGAIPLHPVPSPSMPRRLPVDQQRPQFLPQPQRLTRQAIGVLEGMDRSDWRPQRDSTLS